MNATTLLQTSIGFLVLGAIASYLGGALFRERERLVSSVVAFLALLGSVVSLAFLFPLLQQGSQSVVLFGFLQWQVDLLGWIVSMVGLVLGLVVTLYSIDYMKDDNGHRAFFPLLLLLLVAVIGLGFAFDLFNIYLFFELLALASFALVAFHKNHWEPVEAGAECQEFRPESQCRRSADER